MINRKSVISDYISRLIRHMCTGVVGDIELSYETIKYLNKWFSENTVCYNDPPINLDLNTVFGIPAVFCEIIDNGLVVLLTPRGEFIESIDIYLE